MTFSDDGPEFEIVTTADLEIYLWEGKPVTEKYISFNRNDFYSCREITNRQTSDNPISRQVIEKLLKIKEGFKL